MASRVDLVVVDCHGNKKRFEGQRWYEEDDPMFDLCVKNAQSLCDFSRGDHIVIVRR